jgi:hypothetical protein
LSTRIDDGKKEKEDALDLDGRVLKHLAASDKSNPRIVARLESTDKSDTASRKPHILDRRFASNICRERAARSVQDVGEERVATDEVPSTPVHDGGSSSRRGGDEGLGRCRSRDIEEGRVGRRRGGGKVVDDNLTPVVRVDLEFAGEVTPDFGGGRREDKEEVDGVGGGKTASEGLRSELFRRFCSVKRVQRTSEG